jgi:hypothetical protein
MTTLWFVLPFAAVRYGVRDRFVRLTLAIALGTTVAFLFLPWISLLFAAATLALAAAALLSRQWRRPAITLAAVGAAGLVLLGSMQFLAPLLYLYLNEQLPHPHLVYRASFEGVFFEGVFDVTLLLLALICSRLHRWLLQAPSNHDSSLA